MLVRESPAAALVATSRGDPGQPQSPGRRAPRPAGPRPRSTAPARRVPDDSPQRAERRSPAVATLLRGSRRARAPNRRTGLPPARANRGVPATPCPPPRLRPSVTRTVESADRHAAVRDRFPRLPTFRADDGTPGSPRTGPDYGASNRIERWRTSDWGLRCRSLAIRVGASDHRRHDAPSLLIGRKDSNSSASFPRDAPPRPGIERRPPLRRFGRRPPSGSSGKPALVGL